jgi:hypothetical protein
MSRRFLSRQFLLGDTALLFYLSMLTLVTYCVTSGRYGYFRDEFYYLACGEHLDWGYVDQPPLVALMAFLTKRLLGDSLLALRFVPALAEAAVVFLVGLTARELGGGRFAQCLAAVSVMVAPVFLVMGHIFSMNAFDHLFWALAVYVLILILKHDRPKLWLLAGLICGVGLMNKYSISFLGMGLVIGLLLTPARRHLASKWLWLGGALASLIFLPHILWQIRHGFPTREFVESVTRYKTLPLSPSAFLLESVMEMHPLTFPIWLAGLAFYFFSRRGKDYRVFGWAYVSILALLVVTPAKPYYLAPAYLLLLPGGALVIESFIERRNWIWLKPASFSVLVAGGLAILPFALPILPVETFIRYQDLTGMRPASGERHKLGRLPQIYADMFGWGNMAQAVAKVYERLSPEEKAKGAIFAGNYGEAGAIDLLGRKYGLPKAISGHNNYWYWGPGDQPIEAVVTVGISAEEAQDAFEQVELGGTVTHEYAMPYENNLPVYICRKPKIPFKEFWPRTRHYFSDRATRSIARPRGISGTQTSTSRKDPGRSASVPSNTEVWQEDERKRERSEE